MSNHHIRYVTEKINDVDEVIGRNGGLNIRDDELLVFASADVIFRCKIEQMQAWELLSKDGVVITAPDLEHEGRERTIIVYYVYQVGKDKNKTIHYNIYMVEWVLLCVLY